MKLNIVIVSVWFIAENYCSRRAGFIKTDGSNRRKSDPSMEDAFIGLVLDYDKKLEQENHQGSEKHE